MKISTALFLSAVWLVSDAPAQDLRADMARAENFGRTAAGLLRGHEVRPYWAPDGSRLIYRVNSGLDGHRFVQVDPQTGAKSAAFDHEALAMALAAAAAREVCAAALPLDELDVAPGGGEGLRFRAFAKGWRFEGARLAPDEPPPAPVTPSAARVTGKVAAAPKPARHEGRSPDGKWRAVIRDHNLLLEPISGGPPIALSEDGVAGDAYSGPLQWSPDSMSLIAWRAKDVEVRKIHIVQSSPPDQLQPKLLALDYPKPGDAMRQPKPRLFDVANRRALPLDDALFANPWEISQAAWSADSSEFSFIYNQRGHQLLRMAAIRADSGSVRGVFEERSNTFIDYSQKFHLHRLTATRELLWASERDGHNHIYLIDGVSGEIINRVTEGPWEVREVVEIDEAGRSLLLKIVGVAGQNPYQQHFVRVNFDGSGFTRLTESDGNHRIEFSPDRRWLLATWSRVDQPPVVELRRADNGKQVVELERADDSALRQTGWSRPERFCAKGRDGQTDIHGIIIRPTAFDPSLKYAVVEDIYAGPHDHFVPSNYSAWMNKNAMAELGFIVVSIDGMGTNWRGKAFHDLCWKNLSDSGLPDRIAWIRAAAATRPWMDLTRGVGIYGGSAGGQSTLGALLHHGDFYTVGVADCGCHDNRMDKIWWNEAWMGWPVDESYARNSNVVHAAKLTGELLLVVGELDRNVDPASTAQVVAALQQAGKDFDFLPLMNSGHGAAESPYGKYRRASFLLRHLGRRASDKQAAAKAGTSKRPEARDQSDQSDLSDLSDLPSAGGYSNSSAAIL